MALSATTLHRMRLAAAGTVVIAASGLSIAAVSSAQETTPSTEPASTIVEVQTTAAPTTEVPATLDPQTTPPTVPEVGEPPLDVDDCPGCGLG